MTQWFIEATLLKTLTILLIAQAVYIILYYTYRLTKNYMPKLYRGKTETCQEQQDTTATTTTSTSEWEQ